MKKTVRLLTIALCFFMISAAAQSQPKETKTIPTDPKVKIGTLDNGLTYYIRENAHPEDRAELFLTVNAGAILENPDQNGLAHFVEHMAFNGTKNFEKHEIIHYLQSIGMKFGPEINAFTSHDVTNYMLQKVPTDDEAILDTALMILYEWAHNVSFEAEEIDAERGVIHEEWRTRRGPDFRMRTKYQKTLYKDSKYATHDIIGDIDIIDNHKYETLRSFYNTWYRPDLQAIIVVGDIDADKMEKKIIKLFSQIPARTDTKNREYFEVPDHKETLIDIQTDKEAQYTTVAIYHKHDVVQKKNDLAYIEGSFEKMLYAQMINARLAELMQSEDPPFVFAYNYYGNIVRTKDAYIGFARAGNNQAIRTLKAIMIENERAKQHGFTNSELERAKKEVFKILEKDYNERNKKESINYTWEYFSHFLENEPIPGTEFMYEYGKKIIPQISLEQVNALAKKWITEQNRVVVITGPESAEINIPDEKEVMAAIKEVEEMDVEPYHEEEMANSLIKELPKQAKIVSEDHNKVYGYTKWTFENGVSVIIKPTDFKDDELLMKAYSPGGYSLYDVEQRISAEMSSMIVSRSGVGDFNNIELQKFLAGKDVSVAPYIQDLQEGFQGKASPKELETMLQLVYQYFNEPRKDSSAFSSLLSRQISMVENKKLSPRAAFGDTIGTTLTQNSPYTLPYSKELLRQSDLDEVYNIYLDRFKDASDFVFVFVGNIDIAEAKPLMAQYLGTLPGKDRKENWRDRGIRPPEKTTVKNFTMDMEVPQGSVFVGYTGTFDYNYKNILLIEAIKEVLDIKYTEKIREEQSGTYGVAVMAMQDNEPYENYKLYIFFNCDPEKVDTLSNIVFDQINILKTKGPEDKDVNAFKENKQKEWKENQEKNSFWLNQIILKESNKMDEASFVNYEKMIQEITKQDIMDAAKKYLDDNYIKIIMTP